MISGFQWNKCNWPKCARHGVSRDEIEALFASETLAVHPAPDESDAEERLPAIGRGPGGRWVFVVFTLRVVAGKTLIRPIGARYMHKKEVEHYEQKKGA